MKAWLTRTIGSRRFSVCAIQPDHAGIEVARSTLDTAVAEIRTSAPLERRESCAWPLDASPGSGRLTIRIRQPGALSEVSLAGHLGKAGIPVRFEANPPWDKHAIQSARVLEDRHLRIPRALQPARRDRVAGAPMAKRALSSERNGGVRSSMSWWEACRGRHQRGKFSRPRPA